MSTNPPNNAKPIQYSSNAQKLAELFGHDEALNDGYIHLVVAKNIWFPTAKGIAFLNEKEKEKEQALSSKP